MTAMTCKKCGQLIELHEPSHEERKAGQVVRFVTLYRDYSRCEHLPPNWDRQPWVVRR